MARRPKSRHALPRGRAGLQAANAALTKDIAQLRWSRWSEQLELIRLESLADGLSSHIERFSTELADVRRELQLLRTTPQARDPYVEVLALQAAELRATVATQEAMLSELTARFHVLLAEVEEGRARAAADAAARAAADSAAADSAAADSAARTVPPAPEPEPMVVPAGLAPAPPVPVLVDLAEVATWRNSEPMPSLEPVPDLEPSLEPVFAAVGATSLPGASSAREGGSPTQARPVATITDTTIDDETVRRLRLIRESHSG
jgi:hypothetical protein